MNQNQALQKMGVRSLQGFLLFFSLTLPLDAGPLYRYVTARTGLYLRSLPDQSGAKLALIPFNTFVAGSERTANESEVGDAKGHWMKIAFSGKTGWVFDGFLGESPVPDDKVRQYSPDGKYYFILTAATGETDCRSTAPCNLTVYTKDGKETQKILAQAGESDSDYPPEPNLPLRWIGSKGILFSWGGGGNCIPRKEYQYLVDVPAGNRTSVFHLEMGIFCGYSPAERWITVCKLDRCYRLLQAPGEKERLKIWRENTPSATPAASLPSSTINPTVDGTLPVSIDPGDPASPDIFLEIGGKKKTIEEWIQKSR